MRSPNFFIDRISKEQKYEAFPGKKILQFLYGTTVGFFIAKILARMLFLSRIYGWWNSLSISKRKIPAFAKKYCSNLDDFEVPPGGYTSFNSFFIRKLKKGARSLAEAPLIPADGKYLAFQNMTTCDGFVVKGQKFSFCQLLGCVHTAERYIDGSMVMARLGPGDYHRFHFPCEGVPSPAKPIAGMLYSVNPMASRRFISLFVENKREITTLHTEKYGPVLLIEVGATNVGTIHQTYIPNQSVKGGEEKGFFSLGGSAMIMIFQKGAVSIDPYLLQNSAQHIETFCLFGQSLERA